MNFKKILAVIILLTLIFLALGIPIASSVCYKNTIVEVNTIVAVENIESSAANPVGEIIETEPEEDLNSLSPTTIYTTTKLRLRAGPSTETEIIDTLKINTQLDKIGEEGDWTIVRVNGQKYYVYSKYTSTEKTIIKTVSRASSFDRTAETSVNKASKQESRQFFRLLYFNLLLLL